MIKKFSTRLFFIVTALIVLTIAVIRHPYFQAKYNPSYRTKLFAEFQNELSSNTFDPEQYWRFRERFGQGTFVRDLESTGFFGTFRIVSVAEGLTPLFYYDSQYIRSLDGVISYDSGTALSSIIAEFPGEIVSKSDTFVLIKATETEYVFAFVEPISEMKRVIGLFDFIPKETELLQDKLWYNATYIQL